MDKVTRSQRLSELRPLANGDTQASAIMVAVAVEQAFGIVLSDDDMTVERLCHPDRLADTVTRYLDET